MLSVVGLRRIGEGVAAIVLVDIFLNIHKLELGQRIWTGARNKLDNENMEDRIFSSDDFNVDFLSDVSEQ
nr:hypothetical protein [Brevundimonas subvibrioides]